MKYAAVLLLSIASLAQGFVVPSRSASPAFVLKAVADENTDFDGESVRRFDSLFLVVCRVVDPVIYICARLMIAKQLLLCLALLSTAPLEAQVAVGNAVKTKDDVHVYEVGEIEVEEECYMGKDGDFEECVDFDPVP
jgi:hypothetical protein